MTARQSYHLTFARFSLPLRQILHRLRKPPTPPTASKSTPLPPIPHCRCLPISTSAQRLKTVRRRPYCPRWPPLFQPVPDESPAKQWQGIITSCEKLSVSKDETVYRFVLEPRFAALKHFQSSRLFQNQTVPDIVAAVFKHHGFSGVDYRFQKPQLHRPRVCDPVSRKRLRFYQPSV